MRVKKIIINYIIDFLAIASFFVISISGAILYFVFSHGIRGGGSLQFLGLAKSIWITIHDWSALIFSILIILHFVMHLSWIINTSKNIFNDSNTNRKI